MYLCQLLLNSLLCMCPPVNPITTRLRKRVIMAQVLIKQTKESCYNSYCLHIGFIYIYMLLYYISIINDTFIHIYILQSPSLFVCIFEWIFYVYLIGNK